MKKIYKFFTAIILIVPKSKEILNERLLPLNSQKLKVSISSFAFLKNEIASRIERVGDRYENAGANNIKLLATSYTICVLSASSEQNALALENEFNVLCLKYDLANAIPLAPLPNDIVTAIAIEYGDTPIETPSSYEPPLEASEMGDVVASTAEVGESVIKNNVDKIVELGEGTVTKENALTVGEGAGALASGLEITGIVVDTYALYETVSNQTSTPTQVEEAQTKLAVDSTLAGAGAVAPAIDAALVEAGTVAAGTTVAAPFVVAVGVGWVVYNIYKNHSSKPNK